MGCCKKIILVFSLLALLVQCLLVHAQNNNLPFRHLSTEELLPENHIKCFFNDSAGFVWLGTRNGLARFDGVNVKTFQYTPGDSASLKGYNVTNVVTDKNGNLWVGTDYGVNFYDIHKNTFQNFPLIPDEGPSALGMCYAVPLALDDNGMLWIFIATRYALYLFDTHTHRLTPMPAKADMEFGIGRQPLPGGNMRMGFRMLQGAALYEFSKYRVVKSQEYFTPGGMFAGLLINEARVYYDATDSLAWITCDKGLIKLNYKAGSYTLYNSFNGRPVGKTTDVCFNGNQLFVATAYNGLFVFDATLGTFTSAMQNNPADPSTLQSNKLSRLFMAHNTLFVTFEEGGLDVANLQTAFTRIASRQDVAPLGLKNQISSVCQLPGGEILMGTAESGVLAASPVTGAINYAHTALLQKQLPAKQVNHITANNAYTAVSSNEGLFIFKTNGVAAARLAPVITGGVNYAAFYNDTLLLATTNDGLYQVNIQADKFNVLPVPDYNNEHNFRSLSVYCVPNNNVAYVLAETGGFLHEMEYTGGRFRIKRATWLSQSNAFITQGRTANELLLCGPHGLLAFNTTTFLSTPVEGRAFSNRGVYAALQLTNGHWFIVYDKGAVVYDAGLKNIIYSYDQAKGLYSSYFFSNGCALLSNGQVVLGTKDGAFIYSNGAGTQNTSLPPLYFTDIKVNDGIYPFKKEVNFLDEVQLPYNQNTISFSFAAIDFTASSNTKTAYRMDGVDKAWVTAPRNGFARYANLAPGTYTFNLRNYDGAAGSRYKKINIVIAGPFWREWWFILLCAATLVLMVYMVYLYRIQELIRLQKVRNNIATDLHDDIGSTLTNINILAELSHANIGNNDKASVFIKRITEEVTATSQSLDDIVWSINSSNDSFAEMAARMRRYASDLFEQGDITWQVQFDEQLANKKLKMEQRRDIYLIFKEAVNNIYKHANAKNVTVALTLVKGKMQMQIQDDGQGFDVNKPTSRNGLKNMARRTQKWNGVYKVQSGAGGTTITIHIP